MNDNLISIKDVADVLETTKAKVNYAIKKNNIEVKVIENKNFIDRNNIDIISRYIKPKTPVNVETTPKDVSLYKELIRAKESEIDTLKGVIKSLENQIVNLNAEKDFKNTEIADLNATIKDLREIIRQKEEKENKRNWLTIFKRK